ncbi:hypothetical protein EVAR_12843_1 [Eumeta japonica]|uniref:Uncharacterized protein n=1 Tax=Eumeta variegata TaxID=151549 RepID=A0A4C1UBP4_EUMVA|nr:hypothetical protein EVAR_12843_1 [Eumeta japonica]
MRITFAGCGTVASEFRRARRTSPPADGLSEEGVNFLRFNSGEGYLEIFVFTQKSHIEIYFDNEFCEPVSGAGDLKKKIPSLHTGEFKARGQRKREKRNSIDTACSKGNNRVHIPRTQVDIRSHSHAGGGVARSRRRCRDTREDPRRASVSITADNSEFVSAGLAGSGYLRTHQWHEWSKPDTCNSIPLISERTSPTCTHRRKDSLEAKFSHEIKNKMQDSSTEGKILCYKLAKNSALFAIEKGLLLVKSHSSHLATFEQTYRRSDTRRPRMALGKQGASTCRGLNKHAVLIIPTGSGCPHAVFPIFVDISLRNSRFRRKWAVTL